MKRSAERLRRELRRIDGRPYPAYRDLRGRWSLPQFTLDIRRVQGDPFAAPSRVAVILNPDRAGFAPDLIRSRSRRTGVACLLARSLAAQAEGSGGRKTGPRRGDRTVRGGRGRGGPGRRARVTGSGRSGEIRVADPGQVVLPNTTVQIAADGTVEARFSVGLPAAGRRILGRQAERLLLEQVPALVAGSLVARAHGSDALRAHAEVNEDADHLRGQLAERGLISFIANGAVLPRRSGVDDRPLAAGAAIPFAAPQPLEVVLKRANGPPLAGMGIPRGVTLLVGGGYHGKSTVLNAVARGVWNHRPGDGRECVVTDPTATRIQAEDGRAVAGVDISPFIGRLPGGHDTTRFSTANASGSTSQAAAIIEALEAGARALLIDEDTAATNFMIRDRRMQALVRDEDEPITPLIDRVRSLRRDAGVSSLLVIGGSGDYLDVADRVIGMVRYEPRDLTHEARAVARDNPTGRRSREGAAGWPERHRWPDPSSIRPGRGRRAVHIRVRGRGEIEIGTTQLDLGGVRQIVSTAQARAVARAVVRGRAFMGRGRAVEDVLNELEALLEGGNLDALDPERTGELALPRRQEIAAALSRLRTLTLLRPGRSAP